MKRKIWICALTITLLLTGVSVAKGQYKTIEAFFDQFGINLNGQASVSKVDGMIYKGTIYLPIRSIGETMGGQVSWNSIERSVDIDFVTPMSDPFIQAADRSIYQYVAVEKNQIMNRMVKLIKDSKYTEMKTELQRLQKLEELAEYLEDASMKEMINRMAFSGEVIRSGLAANNYKDYKLAAALFAEAEEDLTDHIYNKLNHSADGR